jgi:hypothetical protein
MGKKEYQNLLRERERVMAFNEGLKCSVYILESASCLSCEAIKYLTESLAEQIEESENAYTRRLLMSMRSGSP